MCPEEHLGSITPPSDTGLSPNQQELSIISFARSTYLRFCTNSQRLVAALYQHNVHNHLQLQLDKLRGKRRFPLKTEMLFSCATKQLVWAWNEDIAEDAAIIGGFFFWIIIISCLILFSIILLLLLICVCCLIIDGIISGLGSFFPIRISINCPCHAKDPTQSGGKIGSDR